MHENNPPFLDRETIALHNRVRTVGLVLFGFGTYAPEVLNLTVLQSGLSRIVGMIGVAAVVSPLIREYQDTRKFIDTLGDDDTDDDDEWPDKWPDDPEDPDIDPRGPSGIDTDWTVEVEEYANSRITELVS